MKIHLSDGEWKLMDRLWEDGPATITQLTHALEGDTGWSKHTIITMLSRLEAKGAVTHHEEGRAKEYAPLLPRQQAEEIAPRHFLDKVYGGSLGLMMSTLVDSRALTQEDIDQLSAILEQAKEESS